MSNVTQPAPTELPSTARLWKSTGIAALVAGALLVTIVLPAEYGVDPTRVGSVLGLTEMGRIKVSLAREAEADREAEAAANATAEVVEPVPAAENPAAAAEPAAVSEFRDERVETFGPDEGFEIKLVMYEGDTARFEWFTDGPGVNYDTHGDGDGINYHGYGKGTDTDRQEGELTAAFTGSHGWFWRNRSGETVTITLRTAGEYSEIKVYR